METPEPPPSLGEKPTPVPRRGLSIQEAPEGAEDLGLPE